MKRSFQKFQTVEKISGTLSPPGLIGLKAENNQSDLSSLGHRVVLVGPFSQPMNINNDTYNKVVANFVE